MLDSAQSKPTILKIWTDASLNETNKVKVMGMAAVICYRGKHRQSKPTVRSWRQLARHTSSVQAEIYAILRALDSIPHTLKPHCQLILLSDCRDVVATIQTRRIPRHYGRMIRHILSNMDQFQQARIIWCRAHAGHKWNELAHKHAQIEAGTWRGDHAKH